MSFKLKLFIMYVLFSIFQQHFTGQSVILFKGKKIWLFCKEITSLYTKYLWHGLDLEAYKGQKFVSMELCVFMNENEWTNKPQVI